MVSATNWYLVSKSSLQANIFDKYNRRYISGYSGSTFIWINVLKNLLGIELTKDISKYLLLAIVCDFVPFYHSLPEILVVYTQEYNSLPNGLPRYTLDKSPSKYLAQYVALSDNPAWSKSTGAASDTQKFNMSELSDIYLYNLPDMNDFYTSIEEKCDENIKLSDSSDINLGTMSPLSAPAEPSIPVARSASEPMGIGGRKKSKKHKKKRNNIRKKTRKKGK